MADEYRYYMEEGMVTHTHSCDAEAILAMTPAMRGEGLHRIDRIETEYGLEESTTIWRQEHGEIVVSTRLALEVVRVLMDRYNSVSDLYAAMVGYLPINNATGFARNSLRADSDAIVVDCGDVDVVMKGREVDGRFKWGVDVVEKPPEPEPDSAEAEGLGDSSDSTDTEEPETVEASEAESTATDDAGGEDVETTAENESEANTADSSSTSGSVDSLSRDERIIQSAVAIARQAVWEVQSAADDETELAEPRSCDWAELERRLDGRLTDRDRRLFSDVFAAIASQEMES